MRFIDLFAGLGGFHVGLERLGHECVFASELDPALSELYERNFGLKPAGDIREVWEGVPEHDILSAGFPCQPYSKAGEQLGADDPRDLFEFVLRILESRRPTFFLLENVPNLARHRQRVTWEDMLQKLGERGYEVDANLLSPHQFGVPQIRERLFIVGALKSVGLEHFEWPNKQPNIPHISDVLDSRPGDARPITSQVERCLTAWDHFLKRYPRSGKLPSFPIWSMEFGADYPYETTTPYVLTERRLRAFRGSHGAPLWLERPSELFAALPSYARAPQRTFPRWKTEFIRQNRELYSDNRKWIDKWLPEVAEFPPSLQKLEWNCQGEERDIWKYVIQFRASGVRVKRPTTAPSLVAMTATQVPIIGWERRYMTPRECARLQSLDDIELPMAPTRAFSALGNAVNARVVTLVAKSLVRAPVVSLWPRDREAVARDSRGPGVAAAV